MDQPNPKECPICTLSYRLNINQRRVRSLGCGHSICTFCLGKIHGTTSVTCPICRSIHRSLNPESIPINFGMEELIRASETPVLPTENIPALNAGICEDHATVKLFYCKTCEEFICVHCTALNHPKDENHKIINLHRLLDSKKTTNHNKISSEIKKLRDVQNKITERLEVLSSAKNLKTLLYQGFVDVLSKIQGTINEIDALTTVQTENKHEIELKIENLINVKNQVQICGSFEELTEAERKVSSSVVLSTELSANLAVSEDFSQLQIKSDEIAKKCQSALSAFDPSIRSDEEEGILITKKLLQEQVKAGSLFAVSLGNEFGTCTLNKAECKIYKGKFHVPQTVPVVDWHPPSKAVIIPYTAAKTASDTSDFVVNCTGKGFCNCHRKRAGDMIYRTMKRQREDPEVEHIYY